VSADGNPALGCAEGALELLGIKPPGRREMTGREWLRGWRR
jgi:methionyl-tRNA formyltransferase